jgi:hypothetical protein
MTRPASAAVLFFASTLALSCAARAQFEGPVPTQALVNVDDKSTPPANASALTVTVNDHKEPLSAWAPVNPGNAQVALLIDDGLRESVGRELGNMRAFVRSLAPGVEVLVGYMQNGRVVTDQPFTTNHELVSSSIRVPEGVPGMSASPYFCLSDFVKKWPESAAQSAASSSALGPAGSSLHKARFVLMVSNGVDPYNGSTSIMNQDSPYVATAVKDAQRAGVAVYAIYFGDAGMRGGSANFSGQSYLSQLTDATGGINYYQGMGNPVSMAPFLSMFQKAIAETYVATFDAPASGNPQRDLVRVKFSAPKTKLRAPEEVRPGNRESSDER